MVSFLLAVTCLNGLRFTVLCLAHSGAMTLWAGNAAQDLGPPDRLIMGFAPELVGAPLPDGSVSDTQVVKKDGRTYYQWEIELTGTSKPFHLVTATAVGNRAFLLATAANGRQWRAAQDKLRTIQQSFFVPPINL